MVRSRALARRLADDASHRSENHEALLLVSGPHPSRRAKSALLRDEGIEPIAMSQDQRRALCRYRFFHPPRLPGAPPDDRGAGPNSGPDSREFVGWMILLVSPKGFGGSARSGR
jgi:hypothetical protein